MKEALPTAFRAKQTSHLWDDDLSYPEEEWLTSSAALRNAHNIIPGIDESVVPDSKFQLPEDARIFYTKDFGPLVFSKEANEADYNFWRKKLGLPHHHLNVCCFSRGENLCEDQRDARVTIARTLKRIPLAQAYDLGFRVGFPLSLLGYPNDYQDLSTILSADDTQLVLEEVKKGQGLGVVSQGFNHIPDWPIFSLQNGPIRVNPVFIVSKSDGGHRIIDDLSRFEFCW